MSRTGSKSRGCLRARWAAAARSGAVMDSNGLVAVVLLAAGILTLVLIGAGEAGVIAGVRERALREPAETRVEALQGLTRTLVARDPHAWMVATRPLVATIRFLFRIPVLMIDAPMGAVFH